VSKGDPVSGTDAKTYREKQTSAGRELILERPRPPVEVVSHSSDQIALEKINVADSRLQPSNFAKAEGTPLPLYEASGTRVDLSKRTKEPMSFWHRNLEADELIFCHRGQIHWETELGNITLQEGEMFVIPRGVAHRSLPPAESDQENIVIELKVCNPLRKLV
jgi:mannose-6-phosphate isomerase-like protein (cupin superfamily)